MSNSTKKDWHFMPILISKMVIHKGLEPLTRWLRVSCSTNWANSPLFDCHVTSGAPGRIRTRCLQIRSLSLCPDELRAQNLHCWGEWRDLNPQPPEPQSEALTNCATFTIFALLLVTYGALCRIRTRGLRLRRPLLYPAELRARNSVFRAGNGIRTRDLRLGRPSL